jgi:hypothetical protein
MLCAMPRAFVELPDGLSVRIGAEGLLLGRHATCDIQLEAESASRRHALLRPTSDGVELVVLGKRPVQVTHGDAETTCTSVHTLHDGDGLVLPGFSCRVRIDATADSVRDVFRLRRGRERFPIHTTPFVVGGGPSAHLAVDGWPEHALSFRVAQGVLYVEAADAGVTQNGAEVPAETPALLALGDEVRCRGEAFTVERADGGDASTVIGHADTLPTAADLFPLPRGGRLKLVFPDGDRTVYLPGRRYKMLAALLVPPAPHKVGDFVPDLEIVPLVWDDNDEVGGRQDVNVVLARCRRDLIAGGIAATAVIDRAPGGRATRFRLAPAALVRVVSD